MSFDQGFRLHPEAAQRSMALSELDNISKALERSLDFWGVMLLLATALVVVGLVAEYWHDINKFWMLLRWPMALFPREELMRLVAQRSMALSELDNISKALERSLDFWGVMLLLATALVVVGLVAEYQC